MTTHPKKFAALITLGALLVSRGVAAINTGLETTAGVAGLDSPNTNIPALIGQIIGIALSLVGVVFLMLMIYGGFLWMTASGDAEKVKKAKSIITNALIGIIIVFAAYAITFFVMQQVGEATDVNISETS